MEKNLYSNIESYHEFENRIVSIHQIERFSFTW